MTRLERRTFLGELGAAAMSVAGAPLQSSHLDGFGRAQNFKGGFNPWFEIDTANLARNFAQVKARIGGKPLMAVVKANAYGHGAGGVAKALERSGARHFLVAKTEEALELRNAGIRGFILNFNSVSEAEAKEVVHWGISQNVYDKQVETLNRVAGAIGKKAHVHIKVDTGLGRVGVPFSRALEFINLVSKLPNTVVDGIFTSFTEDTAYDVVQLDRFRNVCAAGTRAGLRIGWRHAAASDAILTLPAAYTDLDMARSGIMLYGQYPSADAERRREIDLRPVLTLKARVSCVKEVESGDSVGYRRSYKVSAREQIATLPVGYSDGIPLTLREKGMVLIGGRRCRIVGMTCNATIVHCPTEPVAIGDEAVLIGRQLSEEISIREVADWTATDPYLIIIGMNGLVPRRFV